MATFTVGQTLWYVPRERRDGAPRTVTVTKVGRRWITLSNRQRVDRESLRADGGRYTSPGRAYLCRDEYEEEIRRQDLWLLVKQYVYRTHHAPPHLAAADLARLLALLQGPAQQDEPPTAKE